MSALTVSKEMKEKIRAKVDVDEQRIKEAVEILKEWLKTQPHLPHDYDETRLETLFIRCKLSVEKCKRTVDMYYTLRSAIPEIFCNRDPNEPWFKQVTSVRCFVPLPEMTDDFERVTLLTYLDQDPSKYIAYDVIKMAFMVFEIRTIEDYSLAEIVIVDLNNVTVGHAVKYTLPVLKKLQVSAVKSFNGRLKGLHFMNAPPFVDSAVSLLRSVLKPKLAARVHTHRKGSDSLLKVVPPRILPKEYGGDAGSLLDHWKIWKEKLVSYRDWFVEQENNKVDESKRPDKSFNASDLFGFEGSFRQLNVD